MGRITLEKGNIKKDLKGLANALDLVFTPSSYFRYKQELFGGKLNNLSLGLLETGRLVVYGIATYNSISHGQF